MPATGGPGLVRSRRASLGHKRLQQNIERSRLADQSNPLTDCLDGFVIGITGHQHHADPGCFSRTAWTVSMPFSPGIA